MEEIVTIDGRQFKLTTDRPLTALERAQTIADIRKQSGCGCGSRGAVASMGNDWDYGGRIASLAPTCPAPGVKGASDNPKLSLENVVMSSAPTGGIAPYQVGFLKTPRLSTSTDGADAVLIDIGRLPGGTFTSYTLGAGQTVTTNPQLGVAEAPNATTPQITVTYTLDDDDISGARPRGADTVASIIFRTDILDSCTPTGSVCSEVCKIFTGCVAPTCNFVVS